MWLRNSPESTQRGRIHVVGRCSGTNLSDTVEMVSYQPEKIRLAVQIEADAFLVLSDSYYPGWRATINEVEAKIYPVNGLFRGIQVPAGNHSVTFEYRPTTWRNGLWGTATGGLLLALCFVLAFIRKTLPSRSKKKSSYLVLWSLPTSGTQWRRLPASNSARPTASSTVAISLPRCQPTSRAE